MTNRKDILLDIEGDGDLKIENGDFVVGPSDFQHVVHMLEADKGQNRFSPLLGVGIRRYQNGFLDGKARRDIRLNLQADGYEAREINYNGEILKIRI